MVEHRCQLKMFVMIGKKQQNNTQISALLSRKRLKKVVNLYTIDAELALACSYRVATFIFRSL